MQPDRAANVLMTFPPRPLTDGEREILWAWAAESDEVFAFVSERRSDDPAIYRRIVVTRTATGQRLYFIRPPQGHDAWLVRSAKEGEDLARCPTLRAALNFVRPPKTVAQSEQIQMTDVTADGQKYRKF